MKKFKNTESAQLCESACTVPYEGDKISQTEKRIISRRSLENFLKTDGNMFFYVNAREWEVYLKVKKLFNAKTTMF